MHQRIVVILILSFWIFAPKAMAATQGGLPATIELTRSIHFISADGSDVVIEPGRYQIEPAEDWLRVIPGERRDALLLQAQATGHDEPIRTPLVRLMPGEEDLYSLVLLLPDGRAMEAIGSISGVRSRALKRSRVGRVSAPRRSVARIPSRTQQRANVKRVAPTKRQPPQQRQGGAPASVGTPEQTIQALQQRVQTLEQQVSSLLSVIQVSQSGVIIQAQELSLESQKLDIASDTDITINAARDLTAQSGRDLKFKGGHLTKIEGGAEATVKGGAKLRLQGPTVYLGSGSGMKPLAVVGSMTMTAPGGGPGTVTTGSVTVFAK